LIQVGVPFSSEIRLTNSGDSDLKVDVWSYVYRGSKSYSGDREANRKTITIPANTLHIQKMRNIVSDADPGEYKFKVKLKRADQKTVRELTDSIIVGSIGNIIEKTSLQAASGSLGIRGDYDVQYVPVEVYLSAGERSMRLVPYFLIGALSLLSFLLLKKY